MLKHQFWFTNLSSVLLAQAIGLVLSSPTHAQQTSYVQNGQTLDRVSLQLRWMPQFQFAGYYMAQAKKFYADEGLDVQIIPGNGNRTQVVEEVMSRRADFGIGNSGLAISSMQNKPVTVVANIFQRSAAVLITRPGLEKSLNALSQKRLAIRNVQDNPELYGVFNSQGITPSSLPHVTTSSQGYEEFVSGEADAFNAYLGNEAYLLEKNKIPFAVVDPQSYGIAFYGDTIFTHTDFAKKNPDLVNRFARASIRGWIYALDHSDEAIEFLHSGPASNKTIEHLKFEAESIRNLVMPDYIPVGQINPQRWDQIAQVYKELELAKSDASLSPGFYISYWQQRSERELYWAIGLGVTGVIVVIAFGNLWFIRLSRRLKSALKEKDELLAQVEQMANHDQLTGLPNRRLLFDRIDRAIIYAKRHKHQVGVCVIDLNGFKQVNDECGHPAGDLILVEVAQRLKEWIRESDSAGRLGGDEFFFMTEDSQSHEGAHALIQRLRAAFVKPFSVKDKSYVLSFSCGVAFFPEDGQTTPELISKADERMYEEKAKLKQQ